MSQKRLFQYCVIFHEYGNDENGNKEYKDSKLIIEPKFKLGVSEKEIIFTATREIDEKYAAYPDQVEILIRNF